jgi:toxin YoeB
MSTHASYKIIFSPKFISEMDLWRDDYRKDKIKKKIYALMEDMSISPFKGIGKPEPLKHRGGDVWSRRITKSDRLVYIVGHDVIRLISCRGHYK